MALPPERITVKRRRDEDPVDALYIQQKKQRPSAVWRLADKEDAAPAYTELLPPSNPAKDPHPTLDSSTLPGPKVPSVKTTTHNEDSNESKDAISPLFQNGPPNSQTSSQAEKHPPAVSINRPVRRTEKTQDFDRSSPQPRRFHLTKASPLVSPPHLISKSSTRRSKKSRKIELAIFEESKEKLLESAQAHRNLEAKSFESGVKEVGNDEKTSAEEPPRKRPSATLEERKWRAENWNKPIEPKHNTRTDLESDQKVELASKWNVESPEFAEQLQQIALQEIQAEEQRARVKSSHRQLETQPKPPKSRQPIMQQATDVGSGDVAMTDSDVLDEESNYVFDTYVRSTAQPFGTGESAELHVDPLQGIDHGSIGIVVIDDDEEELWETYGEVQESDPGWNSEEEDENAEDFYGNDYPEDEVNSDDEFDRGAYNYRHSASDKEEFGEETTTWSDEEDEARPSRSTHWAHTGYG
ncbi:hypothetical protein ABVK25_009187 [Lepraria finkii]|uniref:Transcription factor Iwr1 domain-containing protein n=1 Tax=Lepraria finkii TaxID=1340010 RepID=A0ABR4AXY2_9LECA